MTIADLKPYPTMKGSGLPWLGPIPTSWSIVRNGRLFVERKETGFANLPILEVSLRSGVRVRRFDGDSRKQAMSDRDKYKRARAGDLAYNMMRMWQGAVGPAPVDGLVSPAYVVARPLAGAVARYFTYLFRTNSYMGEVDQYSHGIVKDRNRLYWEQFKRMASTCPPAEEQADIVRFLDHADRQIRHYIQVKQRLIKLLEEQKQAVIHLAVTRGLDPNARLKLCGVAWLGDVPVHWEVRKVSAVSTRVTKGTTPTTLGRGFMHAGTRFVKVESISKDRTILRDLCDHIDAETDALLARSRLHAGDVLVAIAGAIGRVAIVSEEDLPANCNQAVAIVTPRRGSVLPEWLAFALASPACQRVLSDNSVQSAQANLSLADLRGTTIPVPPTPEQDQVVASLAHKTASIAATTACAERDIFLLREFRARLIADVVTGKLDVRGASATIPDEADELGPLDDVAAGETKEESGGADLRAEEDEA